MKWSLWKKKAVLKHFSLTKSSQFRHFFPIFYKIFVTKKTSIKNNLYFVWTNILGLFRESFFFYYNRINLFNNPSPFYYSDAFYIFHWEICCFDSFSIRFYNFIDTSYPDVTRVCDASLAGWIFFYNTWDATLDIINGLLCRFFIFFCSDWNF